MVKRISVVGDMVVTLGVRRMVKVMGYQVRVVVGLMEGQEGVV